MKLGKLIKRIDPVAMNLIIYEDGGSRPIWSGSMLDVPKKFFKRKIVKRQFDGEDAMYFVANDLNKNLIDMIVVVKNKEN